MLEPSAVALRSQLRWGLRDSGLTPNVHVTCKLLLDPKGIEGQKGYLLYGSSDHHIFTETFPANVTEYSPLALKRWTLYEIVVRPYYTSDGNAQPVYKVGKAAYVVYRSEAAEPPDKATECRHKFRSGCRIPPFVALLGDACNRCHRVFSEERKNGGMHGIKREWEAAGPVYLTFGDTGSGLFDFRISVSCADRCCCILLLDRDRARLRERDFALDQLRARSGCLTLEGPSTLEGWRILPRPAHRTDFGSPVPWMVVTATALRGVFESNGEVRGKGFNVTHSTSCGGRVLASGLNEQRIYSHAKYGEEYYPNRYDCEWLIQAKAGRVRLRFVAFKLQYDYKCRYDYVKVFDGDSASGSQLGFFCGQELPKVIISTSSSLLIRFHTDRGTVHMGFVVAFSAVE
ncbi:hypothetical protein IscW_ISCW019698 [Ixodes scapularis]|uniref:CUB domain-containing protein n=1 Tax=Ixodes scapularis TaxID=6945 RepID=B7PWC9_IXOSC|nr:hypothetical protein IscW_ISCW019698 [Ixodes scapularis]|eukprot:XP_002409679.1 hypothetical protein IscW_ISCW019698 [Ixodes scapularis]